MVSVVVCVVVCMAVTSIAVKKKNRWEAAAEEGGKRWSQTFHLQLSTHRHRQHLPHTRCGTPSHRHREDAAAAHTHTDTDSPAPGLETTNNT